MTLSQTKLEKKYSKTIAERGEWLRENEVGGGVLGLSPSEYPTNLTNPFYCLPETDCAKNCENCKWCDDCQQEWEVQLSWL